MKKILISILLVSSFLFGCASLAPDPAIKSSMELTSASPASTITPEATITSKPTSTATLKPTETKVMVVEKEVQPIYEENFAINYKNVAIKASIITDKSLDPLIKKVYLNPNFKTYPGEKSDAAFGNFISHLFFKVWWVNGLIHHEGKPQTEDFENFMQMWATAQETNSPDDWEKVQMTIKKVNDLNDGDGYKTKEMRIWPMFDGVTPDGIRGVSELKIAFVRQGKMKNASVFEIYDGLYKFDMGSNIDHGVLYEYTGVSFGAVSDENAPITSNNLIIGMSGIPAYMISGIRKYDRELVSYLCRIDKGTDHRVGGLCAYCPNALKTSPSSPSDSKYNP